MSGNCLLLDVLRMPSKVDGFSPSQWDLLVRQARAANLLANLAERLQPSLQRGSVEPRIAQHFSSAQRIVSRQNKAVRWEVSLLSQIFARMGIPLVALKGTAYVLAELPNGKSRLFNDIDILVPRAALQDVETQLRHNGWRTTHNNAYDQRYYRNWMHELPPMQHRQRQTVLDVHHTILPLTARIHPDPQALLKNAVASADLAEVYWLAPEDMVLHSMTHLFHDGELENGLRDLVDIDLLLRHFSTKEKFWVRLVERARLLQLERPLCYGIRYAKLLFDTPVPEATLRSVSQLLPGKLMHLLFLKGLTSVHPTCSSRVASIARWMLYVRAHYLRMPLHLLLPHLLRKALVKDIDTEIKMPKRLRKMIPEADEG